MLTVRQLLQSVEDPVKINPVTQQPDLYQAPAPPPLLQRPEGPEPPYYLRRPDEGVFSPGPSRATYGDILAAAGGVAQAVGALYEVQAAQGQLKSQALSLEFEQSMSTLNARAAEREAQTIVQSGQKEVEARTMEAKAEIGEQRARTGGRGIQLDAGSAADVELSQRLLKEVDVMAINVNAARAAASARAGAVNARNQGLLAGVSANNLRRTARAYNPYTAASSSLLSSYSRVASDWATDQRRWPGIQ